MLEIVIILSFIYLFKSYIYQFKAFYEIYDDLIFFTYIYNSYMGTYVDIQGVLEKKIIQLHSSILIVFNESVCFILKVLPLQPFVLLVKHIL